MSSAMVFDTRVGGLDLLAVPVRAIHHEAWGKIELVKLRGDVADLILLVIGALVVAAQDGVAIGVAAGGNDG